ncbi:hypothetical protein AB834_00600 [PVC group bacterium (ex Bugula neritina AB1)]|nr:hypothetical protein AB834_00600 [PVC group bacterium (ex Bugula neritina AB1)]
MKYLFSFGQFLFKFLSIFFFFTLCVFSDAVHLKNGKVYRGKVREIYEDRVILAEASGVRTFKRSSILKVIYLAKEKVFLSMGNKAFSKDRFREALVYYEKGLKVNPSSSEIKDAILKVRGVLFHRREDFKKKQNKGRSKDFPSSGKNKLVRHDSLKDTWGITLEKKGFDFKIGEVLPESPASNAYLLPNDLIIKVNDQTLKGKLKQNIYDFFQEKSVENLKILINRKIVILRGKKSFYQSDWAFIDAKAKPSDRGFIVDFVKKDGRADMAGLREGDLIVSIDSYQTSSMSMDLFEKKIKGEQGSRLNLRILREVLMEL